MDLAQWKNIEFYTLVYSTVAIMTYVHRNMDTIEYKHFSFCKIWGFHGGDYEEWCLLGCCAMWLL
jgi:hypothetical protein